MLGLAIGGTVAKLPGSGQPMAQLYGGIIEGNVRASRAEAIAMLLGARLRRVESRHRPHYTPTERFRILAVKEFHGMTVEETAEALLVSEQTITRWMDEATKEPEKK